MNSLVNYGSDDDYDDSSEEKSMDHYLGSRGYRKGPKQDDTNYDEVQMSFSEDSNDDVKSARDPPRRQSRERDHQKSDGRNSPKARDDYRSRKERTDRRDEKDKYSTRSDREEERSRYRDDSRDRNRAEKDERRDEKIGKSRERYGRDDKYKDRKEKERKRSRSPRDRERKRSRSRSPRRTARSRSRSKDRGGRGYSKRYDRANTKMERLDKMDMQKSMANEKDVPKDRFFVPGITGRFREQIEKRKLLWQKKEPDNKVQAATTIQSPGLGAPRATKVWESTTFAQDTDGKVANKFKRLMGIKNVGEGSNTATEVLKKQEEMFSSMEQQYEVARTATHTMRGVGLGFGSYQR